MTLLLIITSLIIFSLISNFFPKREKIFIAVSILSIIFFYFFLANILFKSETFYPSKEKNVYIPCGNYYNLLVDSFKNYKLNIFEDVNINTDDNIYNNYEHFLLDVSFYNNKFYLYFGITPILLFYLPFNLVTTLYLTDDFLIFVLSCLNFLLSLFLVKKVIEKYTNVSSNFKILSLFLIGFCNLLPFIITNIFIYQVAVLTANVLLLISFCLFYYYVTGNNIKIKYSLIFFISLFLCLSVGARPHYVLFIPIFFSSIIYLQFNEKSSNQEIVKSIFLFLIPCLIYGTILALYNYIRFDSIFEFGWRHQLTSNNQLEFVPKFKDFIIGLKNNFFTLPTINDETFFSLTQNTNHTIGKEYITGVLWTCPIITILLFIPNFLKQIYKSNKKIFIFFLTFIIAIVINIILTSFFGMVIRYIFEFLSLMIILSVIIFLFYINNIKDKLTKNYLKFLFIMIFVFSMFINMSLLFCRENFWSYPTLKNTNYTKTVNFLF